MDKESIFAEALTKQTPEERRQFLESACAGDVGLRKEIETLLAAHEDAGSFLDKTPEEFILTADSDATCEEDEWDDDSWRELLEPSENPEYLGRLGQYEVIEVLGRGGFGIVLRAHDSKLHRAVAIKLLAPQLALTGSAVQRFLREAKSTAAVSHSHVIAIHSIDDSSRPPMIVMEYVEGQSLQQKIDKTGALDVKSILRIGMQTAGGLAAAHQQGLVHRDIKPANILLENGIERVKLTDFGLARAVDDIGMTRTGQITGTPQYMSPEQAQGQRVDHRTDLFSLGCVMYAMCTGQAAFRAASTMAVMNRVVNDTPRPIREVNPEMPSWLCEIVDKLLAKKPQDRFQTAEEVARLLGDHLAHLQQPDSVPQPERIGRTGPSELKQVVLSELEKSIVPAIRTYRKQTGAGLADARNAVEQIAREHDIEIPTLTPRQRVKQTAITTVTVAVLAWAAATAIEKGVSTFLVTPAFAVVVAVYLMFLIAMWRGSRMDRSQQQIQPPIEPGNRLKAQQQATQVLTLLGVLDILLVPAVFLWLARTFTYSQILAGVLSFSCVLISPAFGFLILIVTLIGRRFHVAKGTLDRETGIFASLLALLPAGPLHLLALPASIWAFRTFIRADRSRPASSSWPLIAVGAAGVLLVVLAGIELQTGQLSLQWLKLEGRGRISVELQYTQTEVTLTGSSEASDGSLVRYQSHAILQVDQGLYHAVWYDEHENEFGFQVRNEIGALALNVVPGSKTSLLIPNTAVAVVIRGPLKADDIPSDPPRDSPQPLIELAMTWGDPENPNPVTCLDVSPNQRWIAAGHQGSPGLTLWNAEWKGSRSISLAANQTRLTYDVAFSPDGRYLAYVQQDQGLQLINLQEPTTPLQRFTKIPEQLHSLAWSPDGKTLVTGSLGKYFCWDVTRGGLPIAEMNIPVGSLVKCVTYSHDGELLSTGGDDGSIYLWEMTSEKPHLLHNLFGELTSVPGHRAHRGAVNSLAFSASDNRLYSSGNDGQLKSWNLSKTGDGRQVTPPEEGRIQDVAISPNGSLYALARRNAIQLYSEDLSFRTSLSESNGGHTQEVTSVLFTTDGNYLVSASEDGTIKWWEFGNSSTPEATSESPAVADAGQPQEEPAFAQLTDTWDYKQGQEPIRCLDVSPNDKYLVSGHGPVGGHAHVWLWDVAKNFQNDNFAGGEGVKLDAGVNVTDVQFSPNSEFYAWTQNDGYLGRRLTETNHSNTESFLPVPGALFCLAWSPDGSWIVTGGEGRLHIWDAAAEWKNNQKTSPIEEISVYARLAGGKTNVLAVAFSPDGRYLAAGCADSALHLFEVKERSLVQTGTLHQFSDGQDDNGEVWSIAWAPDGKSLQYGCENGTIQNRMIDGSGWSQHGGLTTATQVRHYNPVAYAPDGSLVATSEGENFDREGIPHDYRLSLRSLRGAAQLSARGEMHTGEISCLDFTNDGKYLVSGSEDGTIKWWEFAKPLVKEIKEATIPVLPDKLELSDESNNGGNSNFWRNLVSEGSMVPKVRWANRHVKAELTGGHVEVNSSGSSEFLNQQRGESTFQFRGTRQQLADFFKYYKAELRQIAEENGASLRDASWNEKGTEFHLLYVTPLAQGKVGATLEEIKKDPADDSILSGLLTVWMDESFRSPDAGGNPQAELPEMEDPAPSVLSWKQEREGWRSLFDGKTLDGWDSESGTWKVAGEWIVGEPNGVIHSHSVFDGTELTYEWRTQNYGSINRGRLIRQDDQMILQVNGQTVPQEQAEDQFLFLQDGIKLRTGDKRVWFRNLRMHSLPPMRPVLDREILPTDVRYDLFDRLDPLREAKNQWWQPADEGFEMTGGMSLAGGGLLVPRERIDPWADYELETTLTPTGEGGTQVFITFPVGSTSCSLFADKSFVNRIGLQNIDGVSAARPDNPSSLHPSPFQNDVKQTFTITVRSTEIEAHITVKLDGKEVVDWRSEFDRIKADSHWRPDEPWSFGFGGHAAHDGSLTYHSARLRLLEEVPDGANK